VSSPLPLEMGTGFAVIRAIAGEVAGARARGEFPLVLSGNCNGAVGTVSGLGDPSVGILWFDAHGDCETPETTETGYFDGMGLAILAGETFRGIRGSIPGFVVVPGTRVVLLGARQVSEGEHALMRRVGATYVSVEQLRAGALATALDRLAGAGVRTIYIHLDLDVLDPTIAPANVYAEPNGLFPDELAAAIRQAASRFPVAGAGLASYDPGCDRDDRMLGVGLGLIEMLPGLGLR